MAPLRAARDVPGFRLTPSRSQRAPPADRTLELIVQAPMPLGSAWSCSEFRRYLRSLGHRPVPTVAEIAAVLDQAGMHRYGPSGYEAIPRAIAAPPPQA